MLDRLSAPEQPQHPAICFTYWLQWHLTKQLKSASEFARQHQIALKGDLPIGGALSLLCLPMLPVTAPVASRSLQEGLPAGTSFLLRGVVCHLGCQVVRGSARNACCRVAQ